jgi:peptidase MA superfamily protein
VGAVTRRSAVFALALVASMIVAPTVAAAEPVFQPARATSSFKVSIDVEQAVTLPTGVTRVEALVREGRTGRTLLATIPTPAAGATTLRYKHPTPAGSLYPNTPVELGFRITFEDGHTFDGPTTVVLYEDDRFTWRTLGDGLLHVHWTEGDEGFGRRALQIAVRAVDEASALLGVEETEPIDFFIYADRDAFYDVIGPGLRENIGGVALPNIRTLFANIAPSAGSDPWVGVVVPHELTHLVFATATGNPYHAPAHWLNEGLADYLAQGYNAGTRANVERAARSGEIMPLRSLVGLFPTTADRFSLAYDESVSAIDYMIRAHGREALVSLIRSYKDGVSDDATFTAALGVDVAGFEAGWLADLGIDAPVPFGPRAAPPGPVPPGWAAAPTPSLGPGETARPQPTDLLRTGGPTGPGSPGDLSGPIAIGIIGVLAVVLLAGILIVARGLNRGGPPVAAGENETAEPESPLVEPEPPPVEPEPPTS